MSRDGQYVVLGTDGGRTELWRVHELEPVHAFPMCDAPIRSLCFTHDNKYDATSSRILYIVPTHYVTCTVHSQLLICACLSTKERAGRRGLRLRARLQRRAQSLQPGVCARTGAAALAVAFELLAPRVDARRFCYCCRSPTCDSTVILVLVSSPIDFCPFQQLSTSTSNSHTHTRT